MNAKLLVIGRSYASGIERQIPNRGGDQGGALEQLAGHFWKNGAEVDRIIATLRGVQGPLDERKLARVLAAHGELLRITKKVVRAGQTPRSFVSKYLHFHCRAVPIFDRFAAGALKGLYPQRVKVPGLFQHNGADPVYTDFILRFWRCYREAIAAGAKVSVEALDRYLVELPSRRSAWLPDAFSFGFGGYFGGGKSVKLKDGGLLCRSQQLNQPRKITTRVMPTPAQWRRFWRDISRAGVWQWNKDYLTPRVLDGVGWSLRLKIGERSVRSSGSNAYPGGDGTDFSRTSSFARFLRALAGLTGVAEFDA